MVIQVLNSKLGITLCVSGHICNHPHGQKNHTQKYITQKYKTRMLLLQLSLIE